MISFIIDFESSFDAQRFINSVSEYQITSEYFVRKGTLLTITFICKTFSDGLMLVSTVNNLLKSLKIDVRPFSFSYSQLID